MPEILNGFSAGEVASFVSILNKLRPYLNTPDAVIPVMLLHRYDWMLKTLKKGGVDTWRD